MTKKKKKKSVFEKNKDEVLWNVVNAGLAGALVFFGSITTGVISWKGILAAVVASGIVAVTKFSSYWSAEKREYCSSNKLFRLI